MLLAVVSLEMLAVTGLCKFPKYKIVALENMPEMRETGKTLNEKLNAFIYTFI